MIVRINVYCTAISVPFVFRKYVYDLNELYGCTIEVFEINVFKYWNDVANLSLFIVSS